LVSESAGRGFPNGARCAPEKAGLVGVQEIAFKAADGVTLILPVGAAPSDPTRSSHTRSSFRTQWRKSCVIIHWKRIAADQRSFGERYETREFESLSIGFIAPGDSRTAVCMAYDTKLRLEGIPERVQRAKCVSANEDVTFTRLEKGPHHDGVRFANGSEVTVQELGPGVKGYVYNALSSPVWLPETAEAV
jgi:hypothetical protein